MTTHADIPERVTVSVPKAAQQLGVCPVAVYRAIHRGQLPCIRLGHKVLIPKPAFDDFLKGGIHVRSVAPAAITGEQGSDVFDLTAVLDAITVHWLPVLSSSEFKILLLLVRESARSQHPPSATGPRIAIKFEQISERTALHSHAVVDSIRQLEERLIVSVERARRKPNIYTICLKTIMSGVSAGVEKIEG